MLRRKSIRFLSFFLILGLVLGFSPAVYAQDGCDATGEAPPGPAAPEPRMIMANEWTTGTGTELDDCKYRSSLTDGSIDFTITIDQAISQSTAYLTLSTYDVDNPAAPGSCAGGSEIDKVYLNGHYLGILTGASDTWSINSFSFPVTYLTAPGSNAVKVDVDTLVTGCWCVKVDYGTISLSGTYQSGVSLVSCDDSFQDTDGDGKYDKLEIDVTVNATAGGSFNLNGALYSASGNEIGWASTNSTLTAGNNTVSLLFNGEDINCHQANGPYTLRNVSVYNTQDTNIRAFTPQLCSTDSYTYGQFETCTSTCPIVISTSPDDGATGVSTSTAASATFNVAMDPATLTTTTFTVTFGASPMPVAGTVTYDANSKTATFTPSAALTANTVYTATLSTGVKSQGFTGAGCALANAYTWSFTTSGGGSGGAGYCYYMPWFKDGAGTGGASYWSGLAVSNSSTTQAADVGLTMYDTNGTVVASNSWPLPARGQFVNVIASGTSKEGWVQVCSTQPITGLCLIGVYGASYNYMADVPVAPSKLTLLHIPHVAQTSDYDTRVYICNPNSSTNTVTLTYVSALGVPSSPQSRTIAAMGSTSVPLTDLLGGGSQSNGKVEINASMGVAAFALFTNTKGGYGNFGYAGLSGVDPSVYGEACTCTTPTPATGGVQVTVVNATNAAVISGATVTLGSQSGTTSASGIYTFTNVAAGSYTLTTSLSGYSTSTQTVALAAGESKLITVALSPQLATGEIRIVLTWGENPRDLDSHLTGPNAAGGRFHVYYSDLSDSGATLDVDDQYSYGPETVTITQFFSGTYSYYVHQYAGTGSLTTSSARVDVYGSSGLITSFTVPTSGSGLYWHVFNMDGLTKAITPVNTIGGTAPASIISADMEGSGQSGDAEAQQIFRNLPPKH